MTQKERMATLEAQLEGHDREHSFLRELWTTQLEAINARLAKIEEALDGLQSFRGGVNGKGQLTRRDVGVFGASAAVATAVWWMADLAGLVAGM